MDLYRYFNAAGDLLYIGVSKDAQVRDAQHRLLSTWRWEAVRMDVQQLPDGAPAYEIEASAIRTEQPMHNVTHNSPSCRHRKNMDRARRDRLRNIAAQREALAEERSALYAATFAEIRAGIADGHTIGQLARELRISEVGVKKILASDNGVKKIAERSAQ